MKYGQWYFFMIILQSLLLVFLFSYMILNQEKPTDNDTRNDLTQKKTIYNFGSNYSVGDRTWAPPNYTRIDEDISLFSRLNPRPLLLVFHVRYDNNNKLRIVQHGYNNTTHDESKVDYAVQEFEERGFSIFGIKVHPTGGGAEDLQITPKFWEDYRKLINELADKYQGKVPYFFVTNEFPNATGNEVNKPYLQLIIQDVKAKGYKASMSFLNTTELNKCTVLEDLDAYGLNLYPIIGSNGLSTTKGEVVNGWQRSGYIDAIKKLKREYPNKEIFITETGTTDTIASLNKPGDWTVKNTYPDNDGKILGIYWEGTFEVIKQNNNLIDKVFGWDGGIFSPYKYNQSLDIMKKGVK